LSAARRRMFAPPPTTMKTTVEHKSPDGRTELGGPSADSLRVLIVDDNADAAESLALLFALDGHQARVALSGLEACRVAASFAPQLVLLDLLLPDLDGYEVARRLRAQPATANTMLVAMTGYGDVDAQERAAAAGCDAHFLKPFEPDQLSRLAARALERIKWAAVFSSRS
ncbi:MAG TPA: response regulator, partial [Burkholderiaceae bacterium]|nr:response regulator [Burkholderiaceae bacterium]